MMASRIHVPLEKFEAWWVEAIAYAKSPSYTLKEEVN